MIRVTGVRERMDPNKLFKSAELIAKTVNIIQHILPIWISTGFNSYSVSPTSMRKYAQDIANKDTESSI